MKIVIFGATGEVGSRVMAEALSRGHAVSAMVRKEAQVAQLPDGAAGRIVNLDDTANVASLMAGHDVAISALRPADGNEGALAALTERVLRAAELSSVRALIVGGAATLKLSEESTETVLSAPGFLPDAVVPIARACHVQFDLISRERHVDWSYLCPPAMLTSGQRTGRYRLGTDALVLNEEGQSHISIADFAVAMLDEAEIPQHERLRFTVGY